MPTSSILWGATYENTLVLVSPLLDLVSDRMPRAGSEWVQAPSGVEDAWITGLDYTLTCRAAFIPDGGVSPSPVSGALSWQAFLDWGRQKNPFRFVPDANFPAFYVDSCYLVDNLNQAGGWGALGADIKRQLTFTIRNPSVDFHKSMRGLLFDYAPGMDVVSPVAATVSRSTTGSRYAVDGSVAFDAINVLRDRHYGAGVGSLRTTLVEPAATNSILQSQTLATTWAQTAITAANGAATAPDGTTTACTLIPSVANSLHYVSQAVTITANEFLAASIYVKAGAYNGFVLVVSDAGVANGIKVGLNLTTGAIVLAATAFGTGTLGGAKVVPLANGWFRVLLWGAIGNGAVSGTVFAEVFDTAGHASTQTAYAGDGVSGIQGWGAQLERKGTTDDLPPTSYIVTTTTTQTRGADTFAFPLQVTGVLPTWLYADFTERGEVTRSGGVLRVLAISTFASNPRLFLYATGGKYNCSFVSAAGVQTGSSAVAAPNYGDRVQLLGWYDAAGNVNLIQAINGVSAAVVTSAGAPLPTGTWGTAAIGIGQEGSASNAVVSNTELLRARMGVQGFNGVTIQSIAAAIAS